MFHIWKTRWGKSVLFKAKQQEVKLGERYRDWQFSTRVGTEQSVRQDFIQILIKWGWGSLGFCL